MKQAVHEKERQFADSYASNVASAQHLQDTLERDILPGMVDELGLDEKGAERAREWLDDLRAYTRLCSLRPCVTPPVESIFRLLRVGLWRQHGHICVSNFAALLSATNLHPLSPLRTLATSYSGGWPSSQKRYPVRPCHSFNASPQTREIRSADR